jgi:hypothetical protein
MEEGIPAENVDGIPVPVKGVFFMTQVTTTNVANHRQIEL